ncbi:unnamed protein product [Adineta ricciae]|uniref:MAM domain-containing protein n=1 Tax=Adineta ricciae TaxID=249248 RepID=A0A813UGQ1_ADIRI|nr:unnamed protein product [Adineta ricciae]
MLCFLSQGSILVLTNANSTEPDIASISSAVTDFLATVFTTISTSTFTDSLIPLTYETSVFEATIATATALAGDSTSISINTTTVLSDATIITSDNTIATNNTAPTVGGTTAATNDTAPTVGGTTAATNDTAPTVGGTTAATNDTAPTVGGTTAATKDTAPTVGGTTAATKDTVTKNNTTPSPLPTAGTSNTAATPTNTAATAITSQSSTISSLLANITIVNCDCSTFCFNGSANITDGSEFNRDIVEGREPRAPTSDAASVRNSLVDNNGCQIPYNISHLNVNATSYIWFCYKDQCWSNGNNTSNCPSGKYALIELTSDEPNKTISINVQSLSKRSRSTTQEQECLHYYYYMPMSDYTEENIEVHMINSTKSIVLQNVTNQSTTNKGWQKVSLNMSRSEDNYTLEFHFKTTKNSTSTDPVYFALDEIAVYNVSCKVVDTLQNPSSTTTTSPLPSTTTDVGLIVALTLGLGIPFIFGIMAGIFYLMKKYLHKKLRHRQDSYIPTAQLPSNQYGYYGIGLSSF